jgi:hypothetical protein
MVDQGFRGGIAMISHRHAEAKNPEMGKEKYDEKKEHSYISYLDANNLYGLAMVQPLPHGVPISLRCHQKAIQRSSKAIVHRHGLTMLSHQIRKLLPRHERSEQLV